MFMWVTKIMMCKVVGGCRFSVNIKFSWLMEVRSRRFNFLSRSVSVVYFGAVCIELNSFRIFWIWVIWLLCIIKMSSVYI
jgi:hypothetical protein